MSIQLKRLAGRVGHPTTCSFFTAFGSAAVATMAMLFCGAAAQAQTPLAPVWYATSYAGTGVESDTGDGGPATAATAANVRGVAVDKQGNVYFTQTPGGSVTGNVVREVDTNGIITTIAGSATATGYQDGPAASALFSTLYQVSMDNDGNLLIADAGNDVIRKLTFSTMMVSTIAGTPKTICAAPTATTGACGDGGPATSATLNAPEGVWEDRFGNIFIGDYTDERIREVTPDGIIQTYAGTGTASFTGDGGLATKATLHFPGNLWADDAGNLYFGDLNNMAIRKITKSTGIISTVVGKSDSASSCTTGACGENGPAAGVATMDYPHGAIGDSQGNLYTAGNDDRAIRRVDGVTGILTTIAGTLHTAGTAASVINGIATSVDLADPNQLAIDANNNLYIADTSNYRVVKLSLNGQQPTTAVGATSAAQDVTVSSTAAVTPQTAAIAPSAATEFTLGVLSGCALGSSLAASTDCTLPITFTPTLPGLQTQQLLLTDASGYTSPAIGLFGIGTAPEAAFSVGTISTIAGNGTAGSSATEVSAPRGGVVDAAGNIYFADSANNLIRKLSSTGTLSTLAGTGTAGYTGDGSAATAATLKAPSKVAVDAAGNLYIADTGNNAIRYVDAATGIISTIAGTGTAGYSGDGGLASAATLNAPQGLWVDAVGRVYVADTGNNVVRFFGKGGVIATIAGNGTQGYTGDSGLATGAELKAPQDVAVDLSGNVYIADTGNDVVRVIASPGNNIATFAGQQGSPFNGGDGGAATAATLNAPSGLALDAGGGLYIAAGGEVRLVNTAGTIGTVAGSSGTGSYSGEGGPATGAVVPSPASNVLVDGAGNLYIFDTAGNRVLKAAMGTPATLNFGSQGPGTTGAAQTFTVQNAGNSTLTLSSVTLSSTSYVLSSGSTACITGTTLAAGQGCIIGVAFSPSSTTNGVVTGTVTIADDTLNNVGAIQTIPLTGTAKKVYATTLSLSATPASPVYGGTATFTAMVANGSSPTGTVTFAVTGGQTQTAPLNSSGQAAATLNTLQIGPMTVTATYSGDSNNTSSSNTDGVTVLPAVLTITATSETMYQGESLPALAYTITGFKAGDTKSVLTGALTETTTATSSSPVGSYPITITAGTLVAPNYTLNLVNGTLTVQPAATPDFTLVATPSTLSIKRGSVGTVSFALSPVHRYAESIAFACGALPTNVLCNFSPATASTDAQGDPVTVQLQILTDSESASVSHHATGTSVLFAFGIPLCLLGLLTSEKKRKKLTVKLLGLLLLTTGVLGVTSCNGNVAATKVATPGAFTVNVTATDASSKSTHMVPLSVTITTYDP